MDRNLDETRLAQPDPWNTMAEAREHRGLVVAGWFRTAVVRGWTLGRPWRRTEGLPLAPSV